MGEYATVTATGDRVKIGSCESLTDLRADQVDQLNERLSIESAAVAGHVRFRFMFPDEDGNTVGRETQGDRWDWNRTEWVYGVSMPDLLPEAAKHHGGAQFASNHPKGMLAYLPCPFGADALTGDNGKPLIGFNGWGRAEGVGIKQQKVITLPEPDPDTGLSAVLALVVECGGCGHQWRLETLADAQPVIDALRKRATNEASLAQMARYRAETPGHRQESERIAVRDHTRNHDQLTATADRIEAGYTNPPEWIGRHVAALAKAKAAAS